MQHVEACPDLGPICATQPQQPYQHDQTLYSNDLVLDAELGISRHFGAELVFGLRQTTDRIHYLDLSGAPYTPPVPDYHHRNETLVGPTDPWLLAHLAGDFNRLSIAGRAGLTIPLGSTVPNPFELGRLGLPHEHIQFGTGTVDPVLGASIDRRFDDFTLSIWTLDRFGLMTNGHGYQPNHKLLAGVTASSTLTLPGWRFSLGLDVYRETAERWSGVIEDEGNLGRTDVIVELDASWMFTMGWSAKLGLKIPVYSAVVGEQAVYPAIVTLGVSTDFKLGSASR
ncbi:MAG: hypothetical protein QM723_40145 [Myxococcaceae bacterium]